MLAVILMVLATVLAVFFLMAIGRTNKAAAVEVVISKAWSNRFAKQNLEEKKESYLWKYERYHEMSEKQVKKKVKEWDKQIEAYRKADESYMTGKNFSFLDVISLFGYQLLVDMKIDSENDMFRKLVSSCERSGYIELERNQETSGKKNSAIYAYFLMSSVFAYAYVGIFFAFFLMALMLSMGKEVSNALIFAVVGFALPMIIGYLPFDELKAKANRRQEGIDKDFPNVISKIALLVTAGMNITKAIEEAANSGDGVLYTDLRRTMKELNQASTVEEAFTRLQCRCSNKYLDKMVTIVTKSYVAGNVNLADNLKAINDECWLDKRHNSRRMGEAVQNKLFIPTMLMFVGILVVIIVPAMSGFSF